MARLFNDAASDVVVYAGAIMTALPISMAARFRSDDANLVGTLLSIHNNASQGWLRLVVVGTASPKQLRANHALSSQAQAIATAWASGTWYSAVGVFNSSSSRAVYLNTTKGTDTTALSGGAAPNETAIGAADFGAGGYTQFWSGDLADVAIWGGALTDSDVASYSAGVSPELIRPDILLAYWPLWGTASPEIELIGKQEMTLTGTAKSDHPLVKMPRGKKIILPAAAAPPAGQPAIKRMGGVKFGAGPFQLASGMRGW